MPIDNQNEIGLLKASALGDTAAFEQIVSRYQGYICAVTYSATGDVEKSEELAHETFISAWRSLDQLKDLKKFRGWLATIARNVVRNSFRAKKSDIISSAANIDSVDESEVTAEQADEDALTDERKAVVEQALKTIPEKYREVIVLYYRQDQSIKQVASQLVLSEAAVKQRLSRGRKMLKDQAAQMIETTISKTGPSKAFTAGVMGSVAALALKGAATAAAGVTVAAAAGASTSTGLSTVFSAAFSTAAAKLITAAAVAVIAIGTAVVYKNIKSPPAVEDKPVQVADASQDSELDNAVEKNNDENIASLQPSAGVETVPVEIAADTIPKVQEVKETPQYIDPNTLTDIYFKKTEISADGSIWSVSEAWIKKPNCWRTNRSNKTIINNGKLKLELDLRNKTAQLVESGNSKALIPECPQSEMLFSLIQIGRNLITGKDVRDGHKFLKQEHGYKLQLPVPAVKTPDGLMKYSVKITEGDGHGTMHVYVDIKTGLLQNIYMEAAQEEARDIEYSFDYSEIPAEIFSLETPDGYEEFAKRLSPKFQGWIFDKDLNPVANAEIFLVDKEGSSAKGKSNTEGEFNFFIPVGNRPPDDAMEYPVFVRAISTDHSGQVAWTVIQNPRDDYEMKAVVPSPGEIRREVKDSGLRGDCLAVHNVILVLEPAATISGQVLDKVTGEPVANALVEFKASMKGKSRDLFDSIAGPGRRGNYEVRTDENGFYMFTSLPTFAWPKDKIEQAMKAYLSDKQSQYGTFVSLRVKCDGYLLKGSGSFRLTPKDSLTDRQVDFTLVPDGVTVCGRVTDNYGNPVSGYRVEYCFDPYGKGLSCGGDFIRTNENGEYEITGCAYDKSLSMKVETGRKTYKWDEQEATKDKEFIYYAYKYVPVEIENGVYEYEVDIVLEKPQAVIVFDIKDTAGKPIEGMSVRIMWNEIIGSEWSEFLKGLSDKDGKCVIPGLPNMKGETLDFRVVPDLGKKAADEVEKALTEKLKQYVGFRWKIEDLPDGKDGYVVEVTVPKRDEKFDKLKRVKAFDSKGKEIKP